MFTIRKTRLHVEVKFILIFSSGATAKNSAVGLSLMSRIYRDNHMQAEVLVLVFLFRYFLPELITATNFIFLACFSYKS